MATLAVIASHPIQYQAPWFRALANVVDLKVFYCHRQDGAGQASAGFGIDFDWDVPLLEGYSHEWLNNVSRNPGVSSFGGCDTPDVYDRLRGSSFDACIVSGWYLKSYLQAIHACRRNHVPVLLRGDSHLGTRRRRLTTLAKYWPYRWLLQSVDGHLYVGQANREYLRYYGVAEDRLHFVPHFVDNEFFRIRAEAARAGGAAQAIRQRVGASDASIVIVSVGKLIPGKRVADLIEAIAIVRARGLDARALIVGSGPEKTQLEDAARRADVPAVFAGFANQSELPAWLAAGDVLVVPSASETWGLVVNEAMACGLPVVVSSAVGCAPDLVTEGRTGFVFPSGDVPALAKAVHAAAELLAGGRNETRAAVDDRISGYSVAAAVKGTLRALDAARRSAN